MKHLKFTGFFTLSLLLLLSACSNLFENVLNEELQYKTGDDSLKTESSSSSSSSKTAVNAGLVVIKNSAQGVNQITYSSSQNIYYVGTVPDGFSDYTVDYTNGSKTNLLGIDDPVEFRCFANDSNASVKWTVTQIWRYIPVEETKTFKDNDGAEVVYRGISGQSAEKLSTAISVPYVTVSDVSTDSVIQADLPYGVSLVSCLVTADDSSYSTEYKILLTKKYVTTVATSSSDSDVANGNNVTSHGLVVVKATDPGRNAINYSSTTYEYEVGDSTGVNTSLDLTGRDDPVVFKCFTLDENATLSWSARYIKKYVPVADSNSGGIVSQYLEALESPVNFDFVAASESYSGTNPFMQYVSDSSNNVLKSDLPYGVTEVYATITGYNTDTSGNLVSSVTQYKVTLTKRYIITTATDTSSQEDDSGLVVLLSGTSGNQISYQPATLEYTLENLTGANENCAIKFFPEEPFFTTLSWTAVQTQTYESTVSDEVSSDGVTYTLTSGEFVDITGSQPNLIENGTLTTSTLTDGSMCAGNLPYGTTVVTVTATSTADYNSSTTYKITLKKKRVATNIDIESASGGIVNTVTNRGLVVLSASDDYKFNHIPYTFFSSLSSGNNKSYSLTVTAADNGEEGMKFRCYLADTDANLTWTTTQIKTFTAIPATKEVTDSFTGETRKVTYISGQEESECNNNLAYNFTGDGTNNEITLMIPYGVTQVKAVISATNEESTTYIINLTRNITSSSSSSSSGSESDTGSYSLLESLEVTVNSNTAGSSSATLSPEFSPTTTVYTLTVDEEADSLSIAAVAQALGADISDAEIVTKYGIVPGASGMNVSLVGGTSRISFTVTDETGVSRTYYIYVEKPADGDTTLSSLVYTPAASFANGVKGFTFSASNKGVSESSAAPYSMTLSADDRIDVSSLNFTATPNSKRTKAYYGISDSETEAPISWSSSFTKASVLSETVSFSDSDLSGVETANKVLWIKTVSDEYYHYDSGTNSYSTLKESDTTYHKVSIKKAGKASKKLTAMVVVATYEDESTKPVLTQTTSSVVAYEAEGTTVPSSAGITTFADKLDIYFRPLNKDQSVYYTALNTAHANDAENTNFLGYAASETALTKESGTSSVLGDSVNGYYHLTIGKIEGGTASKNDLPNGTTSVTICGETYTFVKPDLSTVSYSVSAGSTGSGVDKAWEDYIYLDNTVTSINMNFTTTQQNESIEVLSCEQTAGVDGASISEKQNAGWSLFHYNTTSGNNIVKWQLYVGNAAESLDDYTRKAESSDRSVIIPAGTTTLKIRVTNGGSSGTSTKDYTFYIIRAGDLESRLYRLTFGGVTPGNFKTNWNSGMSGKDFYYQAVNSKKETTFAVDAGSFTVSATAVSENATITLTKYHTNDVITSADESFYNSAAWEQGTLSDESELVTTGSVSQSYTLSTEDAGTLLFKFNVKGKDAASSSESSERNYYLFVSVEADKTAQLDSLKIVQKGTNETVSESERDDRTILGNSFDPETYKYSELSASLNYVGDIIITPTVYTKASITDASITRDGLDFIEFDAADIDESNVITLYYDSYIEHLGSYYTVSYTVQAQDASVEPVTYTANIEIPEYKEVTETKTYSVSSEYSYEVPSGYSSGLGYRFGSVIADDSSPFEGRFGGLDIVGSSTLDSSSPVWYESSFAASGIQFVVNVGGTNYGVGLNESGMAEKFYTFDYDSRTVTECSDDEKPNIELTVSPKFVYEDTVPYLALTFKLTNNSGSSVMLGGAIDTLVGTVEEATNSDNDSVSVVATNNGFTMNGYAYNFAVVLKNAYGVDDVDNIWYGPYEGGKFINNVFDSSATSGLSSGDSAATFSWNLGYDTSCEKTIRFTMNAVE